MMTFDERAERLLRHPDTVEIEICGETRPWFLGNVTTRLAKEHGIDVVALLAELDEGDDNLSSVIDTAGKLIFAGCLPFAEDLAPEDVTDLLSVADLPRLLPVLLEPLQAFAEAESEGKATAAAQKAQSAADRKKGRA